MAVRRAIEQKTKNSKNVTKKSDCPKITNVREDHIIVTTRMRNRRLTASEIGKELSENCS